MMLDEISVLDFQKMGGIVPAIIQHHYSGKVLMLGFMNQEALQQTIKTKTVVLYSRTKARLWIKGETSGNFLNVHSIDYDCDKDTLLILVTPVGATCHTGTETCFGDNTPEMSFIVDLEQLLGTRKLSDPQASYTALLYASGIKRMAQKVGEEGVEVALAATTQNIEELKNESADLLYHLLVLLQGSNLSFKDIIEVLKKRNH